MKRLANALTLLRIALSLPLALAEPMSARFFMLYLLCGASDVLDGYFARKSGRADRLGAALDSAADAAFFAASFYSLHPILRLSRPEWLWIAAIAAVRLATLAIGLRKYRALAFLHTWANRLAGLALFCLPFLLLVTERAALIPCAVASVSALEELLITLQSPAFRPDRRGIFFGPRK